MHEMFRMQSHCANGSHSEPYINFIPMCANYIWQTVVEGPQKQCEMRGQCVNTMRPIALSTLVYLFQFSTSLVQM